MVLALEVGEVSGRGNPGNLGRGHGTCLRWVWGNMRRWNCLEGPGLGMTMGCTGHLRPIPTTRFPCDFCMASLGLSILLRFPGRKEAHKAFKQEGAISLFPLSSSAFSWLILLMSLCC